MKDFKSIDKLFKENRALLEKFGYNIGYIGDKKKTGNMLKKKYYHYGGNKYE